MHLLNDVAPSHTRVVGAEGNFAFLRGIRNDALLGSPEIVIEQILKPHPGNKQEVPTVLAPQLHIFNRAIRTNFPVVLARRVKILIEFLQQIRQLEMRRRLKGIVILHQTQRHPHNSEKLPTRRIIYFGNIFREPIAFQERSNRHRFLSLLINHHSHPSPTIRMTTT